MPIDVKLLKKTLVKVSKALYGKGIDFVLIGSSILPLVYNISWDVHDVDLFITNKSTLTEPEIFEEIAKENDWDIGQTAHGLLYYEILINGEIVRVDLMENILDIYVPEDMIKNAIKVRIEDVDIKSIRLEDLLLLKAREASEEGDETIARIAELLADPEVKLSIDKEYLRKALNYFPEDERNSIAKRLEKSGIYLE